MSYDTKLALELAAQHGAEGYEVIKNLGLLDIRTDPNLSAALKAERLYPLNTRVILACASETGKCFYNDRLGEPGVGFHSGVVVGHNHQVGGFYGGDRYPLIVDVGVGTFEYGLAQVWSLEEYASYKLFMRFDSKDAAEGAVSLLSESCLEDLFEINDSWYFKKPSELKPNYIVPPKDHHRHSDNLAVWYELLSEMKISFELVSDPRPGYTLN